MPRGRGGNAEGPTHCSPRDVDVQDAQTHAADRVQEQDYITCRTHSGTTVDHFLASYWGAVHTDATTLTGCYAANGFLTATDHNPVLLEVCIPPRYSRGTCG